jgi:hypothetical protein
MFHIKNLINFNRLLSFCIRWSDKKIKNKVITANIGNGINKIVIAAGLHSDSDRNLRSWDRLISEKNY